MSPTRRGLLYVLLSVGIFFGLGIWWARDDLKAWLRPIFSKPVQTSAQKPPAVTCNVPALSEQLVVVFGWREGRLVHRCMAVGSRGAYASKATGI